MRVLDVNGMRRVRTLRCGGKGITGVSKKNGKIGMSAQGDSSIENNVARCLEFSSDGRWVLAAALDGSVQNEILQLLLTEQERSALAVVFITHDLAVVRQISHRVLVMYLGKLCELADNKTLFSRPRHPYTKALLSAVPVPDPQASPAEVRLAGEVASMISPPSGCPFHPRCEHAIAVCAEQMPEIVRSEGGSAACHRATELDLSY